MCKGVMLHAILHSHFDNDLGHVIGQHLDGAKILPHGLLSGDVPEAPRYLGNDLSQEVVPFLSVVHVPHCHFDGDLRNLIGKCVKGIISGDLLFIQPYVLGR